MGIAGVDEGILIASGWRVGQRGLQEMIMGDQSLEDRFLGKENCGS